MKNFVQNRHARLRDILKRLTVAQRKILVIAGFVLLSGYFLMLLLNILFIHINA